MPPLPAAVCNTTPLLYLGRIDQLSWLSYLYHPLYVPQAVVLELDVGRMIRADTIDPRQLSWATLVDVSPSYLDAVRQEGFRLSSALYHQILILADEA